MTIAILQSKTGEIINVQTYRQMDLTTTHSLDSEDRCHAVQEHGSDFWSRIRIRLREDIHDSGGMAGTELGQQLNNIFQAGQIKQLGG